MRQDFLPLAQNPDIQFETMKKLGIDGRSAEERFMDEMREEQKQGELDQDFSSAGIQMHPGQREIMINPGNAHIP